MTTLAKIDEALKLLNLSPRLNNLILITPVGVGTIYALSRVKGLPILDLSWCHEWPTELIEEAHKTSDVVVLDSVGRMPHALTVKLLDLVIKNDTKNIFIVRNPHELPREIEQRCLIYNLDLH